MNSVLVVGAGSQLGQCLKTFRPDWTYLSSDDLDLRDPDNIRMFFSEEKPEVILDFAAYTAVDKAESDREAAGLLNSTAPEELAKNCNSFFYISTDYVFNGQAHSAIPETAPTDPVNAYGATKLEGELNSAKANPNTFVIRTSWLYSQFKNNFVKTMLRLAQEKDSLNIVDDQVGSPTYAMDLAEALAKMVDEKDKLEPGIYHFANGGQCSWFDFAKKIFELKKIEIDVNPVPSKEFPAPAARPAFSVLKTQKIEEALKIKIAAWDDALERCLENL